MEYVPTLEIVHSLRPHSVAGDDLIHNRYFVRGYIVHSTTGDTGRVRLRLRDKKDANGWRESGNQVIAQCKEKSRFSSSIPFKLFRKLRLTLDRKK
jgi:hypothetical protein